MYRSHPDRFVIVSPSSSSSSQINFCHNSKLSEHENMEFLSLENQALQIDPRKAQRNSSLFELEIRNDIHLAFTR